MKRVTILVESADRIGEAYVVRFPDDTEPMYLHERHVVATEHVPDPLPTEPGSRFWGRADDHPAEWWFVTDSLMGTFVCQRGSAYDSDEARAMNLVRLPDPEVAP